MENDAEITAILARRNASFTPRASPIRVIIPRPLSTPDCIALNGYSPEKCEDSPCCGEDRESCTPEIYLCVPRCLDFGCAAAAAPEQQPLAFSTPKKSRKDRVRPVKEAHRSAKKRRTGPRFSCC